MDKGQLLRKMTTEEEERLTLARLLDQMERCQGRNIPTATNFLSPQEQALAQNLLAQIPYAMQAVFTGGYAEAERKIALFLPDYLEVESYALDEDFPLCAVRCVHRPEDKPTHRDFLGSLMGLGVKREMVGDILPDEGGCDILLRREILPFVLQNYTSAGRTHLTVTEVALEHLHLPRKARQVFASTVASLRLDSVISSAFRISRGRAADLIRAGKVEVNWRGCEKADRLCQQGDVFTLRGYGKCALTEVGGLSRKGRITIRLERYQ